ncbi:hypothetical protein KKG72_01255 [bacterium]|nr:hypothetical protein [bacterium]MBU1994885.1 hypothetical protein [bacterium]
MCNFNKQNDETKALIHLFMKKSAETIGGANFLLGLSEALRAHKPHPLITSKCEIKSDNATIKWNKVIFKDKLMALEEVLLIHKSSENPDFNVLDIINEQKKKRVINMVRALAPVDFIVKPKDPKNGGGFEFKIFETIDFEKNYVKINPLFMALFFCSADFTKRALKYEI